MRIVVTVEDPEPGFLNKFTALLAEHGAKVELDTTWTVERATRYYRELPPRAQDIVRLAAIQDGLVKADELRKDGDGSLRGHSGALKRTLERGVRNGWWPEGMKPPIEPQGPGFGKVQGYLMPLELVDIFSAATDKTEKRN
ncbi:hypothetical protein AB0G60_02405 [Streptomyces angustmyceticus]|uniref:Uncharacterized protein n=1 Tax=Streptomyces angustmyceticus TaxID=285578 RepID=A0A5J4L0P9_9ACTN|nr:hypothetical protein [Streptomyces angustmyceticus]UAL65514.1 hypothetical protein K7396_02380 [Streptomyces angustmyceticus]GES27967.1 hypothetical protein San01_04540 [Streptomyces angustmyceticus]